MRNLRETQTRREEGARMRLQAFEDARARLRSFESSSLDDSLLDTVRDLPERMRYPMRRPSAAGGSVAAPGPSSAGLNSAPPPTSSGPSTSATSTSVSSQAQRSSSVAEMRARAFNGSRGDFMDIPPFVPPRRLDPSLPASISRRQPFMPGSSRPPLGRDMFERMGMDVMEVRTDGASSESWMDTMRPLPVGIEVPTSASAVRGSPLPFRNEPSAVPTGQAAPTSSESAGPVGEATQAVTANAAGSSTIAPASIASNEATASGSTRPSEGSDVNQTSGNAQQEHEEVRAMIEDAAPQAAEEGSTQVGTDEGTQTEPGAAGEPERGWPRVYRMWYG
ncbi:uncharacterized protein SCHCODRAFT_01039703 [Schizophyllum commune H4-8]|uniref:Expressed protein n=1 Tax=Schizophyllum commune (strain H4-8 / FGSC 9210) TaxID=578458 RepID=D8QJ82_SCHCM|nr:uncharacterized protein SCHCODRAFT_01039703 [Schizophyllum commune H4-8]KAI5886445.1 hypothetical protein SCHCODRAFT_01039703 [Schizophyllum commune H4-8]